MAQVWHIVGTQIFESETRAWVYLGANSRKQERGTKRSKKRERHQGCTTQVTAEGNWCMATNLSEGPGKALKNCPRGSTWRLVSSLAPVCLVEACSFNCWLLNLYDPCPGASQAPLQYLASLVSEEPWGWQQKTGACTGGEMLLSWGES